MFKFTVISFIILLGSISFSCNQVGSTQVNQEASPHKEDSRINVPKCSDLPNSFSSYSQAITTIQNTEFKISESLTTSKSSWIRRADYYSCDGQSGFFIIVTDAKSYIHANMPIALWLHFKQANSFGSFYDHYIKGKYRIYLK